MERVTILLLGIALAQLNPGRLYWWKRSWAPAPAVLSRNNAQESGVQMTLYFNVETGVTAGVLEVTLPEGFTVSGLNGRVIQVTKQTYLAGEDYQVAVSGLTNPSTPGAYGPLSLRTRSSSTSQILDANLLFASLYIEALPLPLPSLQVVLSGASSTNIINRSGNTLAFKAQLKVPLWKYDLFQLDISPQWTIGQIPQCLSAPSPGKINYYNGSDSSNPRILACTVTSKVPNQSQKVYVYGLAVDLPGETDDSAVQLLIFPVTTPSVASFPSMFVWKLTTLRSGSSTVLETGSNSSGPIVAPDVIKVATWKPTWGLNKADILAKMILYMDLSFEVVSAMPAGSHVTIVVTEDVCTETWGKGTDPAELVAATCYIVTFISAEAKCETSSRSTITISNLPAMPAHYTFLIRNLVTVASSAGAVAQILSINTYDPDGVNIDTGSNLQPFQIATGTTSRLATGFSMVSTGAKAGDWGSVLTYLTFQVRPFTPGTEFVSTSVVTVTCPLSSAPSDFAIYIPKENRVKKWVLVGTNVSTGSNFNAAGNPANGSDVNIYGNNIRWQAGSNMAGAAAIAFGILSTGPVYVTMPLVASNKATAYECSLLIEDQGTPPKLPQLFVSQFKVAPQYWSSGLRFALVCSNNISGAPAYITFSPFLVGIRQESGKTFMVEVGFPIGTAAGTTATGLASGLANGEVYPHACAPDIPNTKANLVYTNLRNYVQIQGLGPLAPASIQSIFFPIAGIVIGAGLKATIRSLYMLPTDPTTRYITHEGTFTYTVSSTASNLFPVISTTGNTAKVDSDVIQLDLTLKQNQLRGSTQWVYIILPKGYRWTENQKVTMGLPETSFSASYFFTSPTESFPYPGVLLKTSTSGAYVSWLSSTTIHIYGYHLPKSRPSRAVYLTVATGGVDGLDTTSCLNTSFKDVQMSANAGLVTGLGVMPSTVISRGPSSVDIAHKVGLKLEHGLEAGGFIVVVLDGNWATTPCTTCWADGLKNMSTLKAVTCTFVGNTITITQFADFSSKYGQEIHITIEHLLPPKSTSGSPYDFLTSVITRTSTASGYLVVDQYQITSALQVSVISGGALGAPIWKSKRVYPDAAGVRADLNISFELPHGIPKCGTVKVTATGGWAAAQGDLKDSCYFSPVKYESCILSGLELQITLSSETVPGTAYELYLDSAIDVPTPDTPIQSALILSSSWFTETLDTDSSTLTSMQQAASLNPLSPKSISIVRFESVSATRGVLGDYLVSLKDSVEIAVGHQMWIKFPSDFDYFLGDVSKSVFGTYPFPCNSPHLPALNCTISHSLLLFTVPIRWPADTLLNLTLYGIRNPYVSRTGQFAIWHLSADMKCMSAAFNVPFIELRAAPGKVDIRSLQMSNRNRGELANATFTFYLYGNVTGNSSLKLAFPGDYDLQQSNYTCNLSFVDTSQPISLRIPQSLVPLASCNATNSTLTVPLRASSKVYSSQLLISLTVFNLTNPLWGWQRVELAADRDFDAWDFKTFPSSSFWTEKFAIEVVSSGGQVVQSTYANLHAGYSGLVAPGRNLLVNGASLGILDHPILIQPGTQTTDLLITTTNSNQPCQAKRLVMTPTTSVLTPDLGQLSYTSKYDQFTLVQGFWNAKFRIAADRNMPPGEYIVDWKVDETLQSGISTAQYAQPLSSLIYVKETAPVAVSIAAIPDVWPGSATPPIRVYLPNSPHTLLNVHFYVEGAPRRLLVQPSLLSFLPDDNERYFVINVTSRYVQSDPVSLKSLAISLSGPDAGAYTSPSSLSFRLISSPDWPSAALTQLQLQVLTTTTASFSPVASVPGTLYWWLGAKSTAWPSFTALRSSTPSLLHTPPTNADEIKAKSLERRETDPGYRENWSGFQRRLYRAHVSSTWTGALTLSDLSNPPALNFTWLWAETPYTLVVFLDPVTATTERPSLIVNFTTLPCPQPQPVRVKFQGSLAPAFSTKIAALLAKHLGLHPHRLFNGTLVLSASRRLQNDTYSSFLYSLLPNRFAPDPSPEMQARLIGDAYNAFEEDIKSELGISNPLLSVTSEYFPTRRPAIGWTQPPQPLSSTNSSVSLYLRATVPGSVCCVALNTSAQAPDSTQVFLGVDAGNFPSPQGCISTNTSNATNTLKVQGLNSGRYYFVYCIATDDYPLWATLMEEKDMAKVEMLTLTYNATQQQDLSQAWTVALSALVGIVLV